MTAISPELTRAVERYGRPNAIELAARAVAEREDVVARFPVNAWPDMPLERYALGVGDPRTYCGTLEFHTPHLGSIRGGSARKHIIYYRRESGAWWLAGPLAELEPHQAWERVRHQFVDAITAARDGDVDGLDRFALLRSGPALVTKTLAIYAPDHFLRINSGDHIRRFIRLLGENPLPDAPSWVLNRQLKRLVEQAGPFAGWDQEEVLQFFYTYLDPRTGDQSILKISLGENARVWDDCLAERRIRIGFSEVSDLRGFTSDDDLFTAVEAAYPDKGASYQRKLTRQLLRYRDLPSGTRIVANRGTSEVLGLGTVTDEGYRYDETLPEYRHVVGVDWDTSYAQHLEVPARGWVPTFNNVSAAQWATIQQGRRRAPGGAEDRPALEPVSPPVPDQVEDVLRAVRRKGQVIIYGPPGTGKTRLALISAMVLIGRGTAVLGDDGDRSDSIKAILDGTDESSQVVLTSFHPSLGYEDFVEGYKPAQTGRGGLELVRRDGLFLTICDLARKNSEAEYVLIIDEINRADLARVLGELVTLLELDKREVVTARLAVSGRTFAVPRNVRIIGTMNTADRSVAHLDAAVRRRFAFIEAAPDSAVLESAVGPLNLASLLDELNERLRRHISRDHQLGHAFLLENDLPVDSADAVAAAFYHDVVPQIEDYALGDRDVLARILGEQLVGPDGQVITLEPEDLLSALATEFSADVATLDA